MPESMLLDYQMVEKVYGWVFSIEETYRGWMMYCNVGFNGGPPSWHRGHRISATEAWSLRECLLCSRKPIVGNRASPSGVTELTRELRRLYGLVLSRQRVSRYHKRWRIKGFFHGGEEEADDPRICAMQAMDRLREDLI